MASSPAVAEPRARWWTVLLAAVLYAVVGLVTLLLTRYTGLAAPFWPAAGIAFALVHQRGLAVSLGVAAGSFVVNSVTLATDPVHWGVTTIVLTAVLIASGAGAQALVGAVLVRRRLGRHVSLTQVGQIAWFLALAGPVACLVNSTVGVGAQLLTGVISAWQAPLVWVTWWAGDSIGVIVAAPITLMLLRDQADVWRDRRWKVAVPSVVVTMVLLSAFVSNRTLEQRRVEQRETETSAAAVSALDAAVGAESEVLYGIGGLVESSAQVTAAEFRSFTRSSLERYPTLRALSWNPFVERAQLRSFERSQRAQPGLDSYVVTERTPDGTLVPVGRRAAYVPVTYIEPLSANRAALGFDILSDPVRAATVEAALDSGEMRSTAPVDLVQETSSQQGMLTILPVYEGDVVPVTQRDRRNLIVGFAVGVYRLGDLVGETYAAARWDEVDIVLLDVTDPEAVVEVGHHRVDVSDGGGATQEALLEVNGRVWELQVTASAAALADVRASNVPALLLAGVLVIALLEVFLLLVTGLERSARREAERSSYAAEHDPLTDVYNRRGFRRALAAARERTLDEGAHHVLMFLDLDGFKAVNDRGGHEAGDALLQLVATAIQRHVRRRDVVARVGGDEFAVLLNDCGVERGLVIARAIVDSVSRVSVRAGDDDLSVAISIGAVPIAGPVPPHSDELVAAADRACYAAKRAGGGVMLAAETSV